MATAGGTLTSAWNATKWGARNLTPLGKTGRTVWAIGAVAAVGLACIAPPAAFAAAAQGITAGSGIGSYITAGTGLAFEGTQAAAAGVAKAYSLMPWDQVAAAMSGTTPV